MWRQIMWEFRQVDIMLSKSEGKKSSYTTKLQRKLDQNVVHFTGIYITGFPGALNVLAMHLNIDFISVLKNIRKSDVFQASINT